MEPSEAQAESRAHSPSRKYVVARFCGVGYTPLILSGRECDEAEWCGSRRRTGSARKGTATRVALHDNGFEFIVFIGKAICG